MRILHIFGGYGGGTSMFIQNLARGAAGEHLTFDTLSFTPVPPSFRHLIRQTGGEAYRMENPKREGWATFRHGVEAPLRVHRYDALHFHLQGYRVLPFLWIARRHHVPIVLIHAHGKVDYRVQGGKEALYRRRDQWLNRHLSAAPIGCGTQAIHDVYGATTEVPVVIPNAIEIEPFLLSDSEASEARELWRARWGVSDGTPLVGLIGRYVAIKNHHKCFDIAAYTKAQGIAAHFVLVGAGECEEALRREVRERALDDVVTFVGRVEPLSTLYPALDALVLPSFSEGFPTVVLEAQAARVPAVISDVITPEVDFGLNLVHFADLGADAARWWQEMEEARAVSRPSRDAVCEAFVSRDFTIPMAAHRYALFLEQMLEEKREGKKRS